MNAAYARRWRRRSSASRPRRTTITGVVITSAKKTFFAGGDLNDLKAVTQGGRARVRRAACARSRRSCAGWRRSASRSSRRSTAPRSAAAWRSRSPRHHRIVVDDPKIQLGFPEVQLGLLPGAGGVVRTVRMLGIVDALMQLPAAGQAPSARRKAQGDRPRRRARRAPEDADPGRQDSGSRENPEARPAVGRQGLQDPRRHAVEPEARAEPAGVPGQPAQAAQGRELPGPAPHHGRGRRGRAGRLRHRARDRGPLLRRPRHRPGREEHDPGVLLRPAAGQRRPRPAGGHRAVRSRRRSSCSAPA